MASTECPICSRHVRAENLELHVEACLQKSIVEEKRRKRALELSTPLFSPMASSKGSSQPSATNGAAGGALPTAQQQSRRHSFPSASVPILANDTTQPSSVVPSPVQSKKRKREQPATTSSAPLAERMRPTNLDDLVGQEELLGPGKLLSSLIQADRVPNMILWG